MQNNSIIKELDKASLVSEIILLQNTKQCEKMTFVIVEGVDDVLLMKKFLNNNAYLLTCNDGSTSVECIVNKDFREKENVIGIRDKDYLSIPSSHKIYFYDYNSLEIMVESNNTVFEALYSENYHGKMTSKELFWEVLNRLRIVSIVRKLNHDLQLQINFKPLRYDELIKKTKKEEWNDVVYEVLRKANASKMGYELKEKVFNELGKEWSMEDFLNYTQGHDFNFMLHALCAPSYPKSGLKADVLEKTARTMFSLTSFKRTSLYKDLKSNRNKKYKSFLMR